MCTLHTNNTSYLNRANPINICNTVLTWPSIRSKMAMSPKSRGVKGSHQSLVTEFLFSHHECICCTPTAFTTLNLPESWPKQSIFFWTLINKQLPAISLIASIFLLDQKKIKMNWELWSRFNIRRLRLIVQSYFEVSGRSLPGIKGIKSSINSRFINYTNCCHYCVQIDICKF